jgi:hypothetical protein
MARHNTPRADNYVTKLHRFYQTGVLPCEVGLSQLTIAHDNWCGIFQKKRCDCDPDIRLKFSLAGSHN